MRKKIIFNSDTWTDIAICTILFFITFIALYPLWFVLIASFSKPGFIASGQVVLLPKGFTLNAYRKLLRTSSIWLGYRNSLFYTVFGTLINMLVTIPCAYALSRPLLPGRKLFSFLFIFTMYFSGGLIPNYMLYTQLHLTNTIWVLLLPGAVNVFNLIIARSFFDSSIPEALLEATKIDGGSYTRFFLSVALPLSKAMLAVLVLFYALGHWNSYFNAMVYIHDMNIQTLQVIIKGITATLDTSVMDTLEFEEIERIVEEKQLLKYSIVVVSVVPMMCLYPFIQKYFISGIMIGAIKG